MSESESGYQTRAGSSALEKTTQSNAPKKLYLFLMPPIEADELGRLGNYRVPRSIGIGGMGFVFEAEEISLCRRGWGEFIRGLNFKWNGKWQAAHEESAQKQGK